MKEVVVRNVRIKEWKPKICAPLVGKDQLELLEEVQLAKSKPVDLVEWRMDHFVMVDHTDKVLEIVKQLRNQLRQMPLLATFRTQNEGGNHELTKEQYVHLYQQVITSQCVDLIDLEWQMGVEVLQPLISLAHKQQIPVILSHHNFKQTPSFEEMQQIFQQMNQYDPDILKLAVMPQTKEDVTCLMDCAKHISQMVDVPIVALSMSELGKVTRIQAETFGSAITFGTLKNASAPGQIPVEELYHLL